MGWSRPDPRNANRPKSRHTWLACWRNAAGKTVSRRGFKTRSQAKAYAAERTREAQHGRLGWGGQWRGLPLAALDVRAANRRAREAGQIERVKPSRDHVADFMTTVRRRELAPKYVATVEARLVKAVRLMGVRHAEAVTPELVEEALAALRREGLTVKVVNEYLTVLRRFFEWGQRDARNPRWTGNPAAAVERIRGQKERAKRPRRALSAEELDALVAAARERPRARYLATHPNASDWKLEQLEALGHERAVLYLVAGRVGLRKGELRQLVWGDIELDAMRPVVTVRAHKGKAGRKETLPLGGAVAGALRDWKAATMHSHWRQPDGARKWQAGGHAQQVFPNVAGHGLNKALWRDLAAARIPKVTEDGRIDCHSLRHTACTLICEAGTDVETMRKLCRHRDLRTTQRYLHTSFERMAAVADRVGT